MALVNISNKVLIGKTNVIKRSGSHKPPSTVSSRKRSRVKLQREVYIIVLLTQSEVIFRLQIKLVQIR